MLRQQAQLPHNYISLAHLGLDESPCPYEIVDEGMMVSLLLELDYRRQHWGTCVWHVGYQPADSSSTTDGLTSNLLSVDPFLRSSNSDRKPRCTKVKESQQKICSSRWRSKSGFNSATRLSQANRWSPPRRKLHESASLVSRHKTFFIFLVIYGGALHRRWWVLNPSSVMRSRGLNGPYPTKMRTPLRRQSWKMSG